MQELIADLPLDDRPREKMRRHGAEGLSDAELIALLLGSGTRGKNAIQLARELLRGGLASLGSVSADCMAQTNGVGYAKATRIGAAFEIARRLACGETADGFRYDDAIVARALIARYAHESQEHLGIVLFHNHPSGDPAPSAEDLTFTKRIQQSLSLVEIDLVDHLIVGAQRYCSMRTKGLL